MAKRLSFSVLFILILRASSKSSTVAPHLSFNVLSKDLIDGVYRPYSEGSSVGVQFVTTADSLSVLTLDGEPVIQVSKAVGGYRVLNIDRQTFLQKSGTEELSKDYAVPFNTELQVDRLNYLVAALHDVPMDHHSIVLQESVFKLAHFLETKLFIQAAIAMGTELSISGKEFPSALSMYMTAMQLDKLLSNNSLLNPISPSVDLRALGLGDDDCLAECPPCEDDLCLGMCGYSCHCWQWVCGDCCYHLGCYGHDVCCREKFVQTKCLFPIGITCESEYTC